MCKRAVCFAIFLYLFEFVSDWFVTPKVFEEFVPDDDNLSDWFDGLKHHRNQKDQS